MPNVVISDTTCLIILTKINEIEILSKLYSQVLTTDEVQKEFGQPLPVWIEIKSPKDKSKLHLIEQQIDKGEASAIALALEIPECTIILDDLKARKVAESYGLKITGTLGILIKARNTGVIKSIKPYLEKIKNTDFRLTDEIENEVLKQAGELY